MNIQSLEEQIVSEKGTILGWIHNHPFITATVTFFIGLAAGHL